MSNNCLHKTSHFHKRLFFHLKALHLFPWDRTRCLLLHQKEEGSSRCPALQCISQKVTTRTSRCSSKDRCNSNTKPTICRSLALCLNCNDLLKHKRLKQVIE